MKCVNLPISPLLFYQDGMHSKCISSHSFYPIQLKILHNVHKTQAKNLIRGNFEFPTGSLKIYIEISFFIKNGVILQKKMEDLYHSFSKTGTRWNIKISSDQILYLGPVYTVYENESNWIKTVGGDTFGVWSIFVKKHEQKGAHSENPKFYF